MREFGDRLTVPTPKPFDEKTHLDFGSPTGIATAAGRAAVELTPTSLMWVGRIEILPVPIRLRRRPGPFASRLRHQVDTSTARSLFVAGGGAADCASSSGNGSLPR